MNFLSSSLPELDQFSEQISNYDQLYKFSVDKSDEFWSILAKNRLEWIKTFDQVHSGLEFGNDNFEQKWFINGTLNTTVNCIDRHCRTNPNKTALIWEKDEPGQHESISYCQLSTLTNKFSNLLLSIDVKKGDNVIIYMPTCLYAVVAMLACARIGAVHSVVFGGFSSESLASRIETCRSKVVITCNQSCRGGKLINFKQTVDKALESCEFVQHVLVYKRTSNSFDLNPIDIVIDEVIKIFHYKILFVFVIVLFN